MFSKALEQTLNDAFMHAKEKRYEIISVEHLLLALIDNPEAAEALAAFGTNLQRLKAGLGIFIEETTPHAHQNKEINVQPTFGFQRVLQRAVFQVQSSGKTEVTGASVLVAIFGEQESQAVYFLNQENVCRMDIINYLSHGLPRINYGEPSTQSDHPNTETSENPPQDSPIDRFTVNLNERARLGQIDPLIGRKEELERTIQVLCRRRKNNPLFIGEAGVGKTAIAEGLAQKIVNKEVPQPIAGATVFALDLGVLLAGTKYRGDFEKRFKIVIKALKQIPGAIIFIDEVHTIIGAGAASGGAVDASNLLKPLLASGDIRCMGSTTYQEYRSIFEKDHALARRFQKIDIVEPTQDETLEILKGLKSRFEDYHHVKFTMPALRAAVELSARHIIDRHLPDKAIDVVDEAGSYQRLQPEPRRKKIIGRRDVEEIVARLARIPSQYVSTSDRERLQYLERDLKLLVFGQDKAINSLATAIKLARSGLREEEKPIGSFLFAGPTGVGKTEVTVQLARALGIELIRFDMSEYMERHTVSRLIGAPPGYVGYDQGGLLTEAVTKHPHAVVLFDEIEKAHPDVFNLLLQVMDHGKLTDNNGRQADFSNVVIIMTTNAGAEQLEKQNVGFSTQEDAKDCLVAVKHMFSPEFRNRLDAIIQFNHLDLPTLSRVVNKFITELEVQLAKKQVELEIDQAGRNWILEHGYDRVMGARPMGRLIQDKIKQLLAEELLFGRLESGGVVRISAKGDELSFEIESHSKAKEVE